jgi:predicted nucleic acid-binding protein
LGGLSRRLRRRLSPPSPNSSQTIVILSAAKNLFFLTGHHCELIKNNLEIKQDIQKIGIDHLAISAITAGELYFGAFNQTEMNRINKHLENYFLMPLTQQVTSIFLELMRQYSLSHKPFIGDMLIAATALHSKMELFTLNVKDFRFIPELKIYNPSSR